MKGFWTVASAHVLHLPSIIVQVFKVLASSEKYIKIPENYFRKLRCFPRVPNSFWMAAWGRNLPRRFPEQRKSFLVSRVQRVLGKYPGAAERCGRAPEGWQEVPCMSPNSINSV